VKRLDYYRQICLRSIDSMAIAYDLLHFVDFFFHCFTVLIYCSCFSVPFLVGYLLTDLLLICESVCHCLSAPVLLTVVICPDLCFPDAPILSCVGSRLKAVETERERVRKEVPRLLSHPHLLKKTSISLFLFLGVPLLLCQALVLIRSMNLKIN